MKALACHCNYINILSCCCTLIYFVLFLHSCTLSSCTVLFRGSSVLCLFDLRIFIIWPFHTLLMPAFFCLSCFCHFTLILMATVKVALARKLFFPILQSLIYKEWVIFKMFRFMCFTQSTNFKICDVIIDIAAY